MNKHQQLYKVVEENYGILINTATKIVGREQADDVVQNAILYLLKRIKDTEQKKYKPIKDLKLELLIQTVKTRALDQLKKNKNDKLVFFNGRNLDAFVQSKELDPAIIAEQNEILENLKSLDGGKAGRSKL